jgi:type I restriction enzyme S subunit
MTQRLRLDKFAQVGAGNSAPQNEALFKGGSLPFVRTSDVGAIHIGSIETSRDLLTLDGAKGLKLHPCGTILFPKSGASTFLNHRVVLSKPAYVSSHLATIKANNDLAMDRYLFYFLQTIDARDLCQDQAYPSLNRDQIAGIEVPLPSIEKQCETVEKLDSVFTEIDLSYRKTSASLEFLSSCFDSFLDRILQDQILKYGQKKLVEVLDIARGGSPRPIDSYLTDDLAGVNWIKISDATSSKKYITETAQRIKPEGVSRSRLVNPGDFLLSNSMSFGRPYIMGTTGCIHDGWLVLSNNRKLLNQDFLYYVLGSKYIYEQFNRTAAGSTVRNLNISLAGQVTFPVPDLETQESLVSQLVDFETAIDELKESMVTKLRKLIELKNSFLYNSFGMSELSEAVA